MESISQHSGHDGPHPIDFEQISVALPCFNESAAIGMVIDSLLKCMPKLEIIVVDDGSTDDSVSQICSRPEVLLIQHNRNKGQGASLVSAMRRATRKYILWYDADGQHTPEMAIRLLTALPNYDCVIGQRSAPKLKEIKRSIGRLLLRWMARIFTGTHLGDVNCGLRAFRQEIMIKYLHLLPPRFSASTVSTILMHERGYRIGWVDIDVQERIGKSSLSLWRDGWQATVLIIHLVQLFHPLRFFLPVSLSLVLFGTIYGIQRALFYGRGIPDLAVLLVLTGVQILFFGLVSDQISAIRKERFE